MVNNSINDRCVQCTLVGDSAVGKTSLVLAYAEGTTDRPPPATVFDNYAGKNTFLNNTDTCDISYPSM